ncbi:peptidoglycan-binding protein [Streptomyces sp. NPDC015220]|uniref:peptidoglycan-binding domain-containing protein n=1 Tax=Streptomyces sp. NPDC015220 TaxID=3364947 RepID=UPI0036FF691F
MASQRRTLLLLTTLLLAGGIATAGPSAAVPVPKPTAAAQSTAACGYYSGTGQVQAGQTYPDRRVAEVQCLIDTNTSYQPPLPIDGIMGPQTVRAIYVVQQHAGITPDGIVGAKTWAALRAGVWW